VSRARPRVASDAALRSNVRVHPLIFVTLLGLLTVLFGITGLVVHRSRTPSDAERNAGSGVAGLKRVIAAGDWGAALPPLLITGGLLTTMVFGALTLAVVFRQRATGVLMLGVTLFMLLRIVRDYRRA
jgi:hypothetical protein